MTYEMIIAGGAFGAAVVVVNLLPLVRTLRDEVRFARYKREVNAIWAQEVASEDIVAHTGADCWWAYFNAGKSPREAVLDAEF